MCQLLGFSRPAKEGFFFGPDLCNMVPGPRTRIGPRSYEALILSLRPIYGRTGPKTNRQGPVMGTREK